MNSGKDILTNKKSVIFPKILGALVFVILCFALLNLFNFQIRNIFHLISRPVEKSFLYAGQATSGFLSSILNSNGIISENENLKSKNQELLYRVAFLESALKADYAKTQISELY